MTCFPAEIALKPVDSRLGTVRAVIIKVTNRCNLDCKYCYETVSTTGIDMALSDFKITAARVLSSTKSFKVQFIFHGGEPSLLSGEWYLEAVSFVRDIAAKENKSVEFGMQTNLLGLTPEKLKTLKSCGIHLSASLDGPPSIPSLRGKAVQVVEKFRMACEMGLRPGVLMTINHANYSYFKEIIEWVEYELNAKDFKANVASSVGTGLNLPDLSPERIFEAQKEIIDYMIRTEGTRLFEHNIALEILKLMIEDSRPKQALCSDKICGAGSQVVGIAPDGRILPCGRFAWHDREHTLGSIHEQPSSARIQFFNAAIEKFHSGVPEVWADCDTCLAKRICAFGCKAFILRSRSLVNLDCLPTKMRFDYYIANADKIRKIGETLQERGVFGRGRDNSGTYTDYSDRYDDYNDRYTDYHDRYSDYTDYSDSNLPW